MADAITIRVLTDAGLALEDEAVSIVTPGELGYLGILRNHAPLVTTLKPGTFTWRRPSGEARALFVTEGLLEITHNRLTVQTGTVTDANRPTSD